MAGKEQSANPLTRPSFLISAVMVFALLVGLGFLVVTRDKPEPVADSEPSTVVESETAVNDKAGEDTPVKGESDSVCGLIALDDVIPENALPSTPIEVGEHLSVPSIDGYGPGVTEGISHCFAHNPSGAVLAAANFMTWFSSKEQLDEVSELLFAEGPNKDRLVQQIKDEWQGETGSPFNIHGYIYEDRGPDNAMVVLAVSLKSFPDNKLAWPVVLTWQDGDWKVEAPSVDNWGERPIDSLPLEGFVEWNA